MSLAQQEFIGRRVTVTEHSDPALSGLTGTVVDETRETLLLDAEGSHKRVAKRSGRYDFDGETVAGDRIAFRPQDRTRRGAK